MSRHLRPTAPQPPTEPGKVILDAAALDRARIVAGLLGVATYSRIVACAQYAEPCTPLRLADTFGDPSTRVAETVEVLLRVGLIQWSEEGGAQ